jgi:hypothetical protein
VAVVRTPRVGLVLKPDGDVREVEREIPRNRRPSRGDGVDVLLVRYVTRQLEAVEVAGHGEQDLRSHVPWEAVVCRYDRCKPRQVLYTCERAESISKTVPTRDTSRDERPPDTCNPVMA